MKKILIAIISLILLVLLVGIISGRFNFSASVTSSNPPSTTPPATACTMDAKICPDGSAVGRVGPSCEFAACPITPTTPVTTSPVNLKVGIGKTVAAYNTSITPIEILEDSRCPANVNCIWAGTVRLRTKIASKMGTLEETIVLNTPLSIESSVITLLEVSPQPVAGSKIGEDKYQFTFSISPK